MVSTKSPCIYLAPFQGITGVTFRDVYTRYFAGVDKLFTPFFNGIQHDSKLPARKLQELGKASENGIEVVPQILSKDADEIKRFAVLCHNMGFGELNWNLGCPYPMVAKKKRGSGMLPYPEMIDEILTGAMTGMPLRFSVKCRLGYLSAAEIDALVPIFNRHSISEITIHARIGKQLYSGETNLVAFEKAISVIEAPVVYNGDIFTPENFRQINARFPGISTYMIGRGLLSDPFLPARIKGLPLPENEHAHISQFIAELYQAYRKQKNDNLSVLGNLKEYWHYLAESFNDPHKVFKQVKKVNSFGEYEDAVSVVFSDYTWIGSAPR